MIHNHVQQMVPVKKWEKVQKLNSCSDENRWEPTTNLTQIWCRVWISNLVGGEHTHHYTNPAPLVNSNLYYVLSLILLEDTRVC